MSRPGPRRALRLRAGWRGPAVLACLVLVVPGPAAAAPPTPAAAGVLAGTTTVTWRGNAGIRLAVPRTVRLDEEPRLFVTGGTYAFVRVAGAARCAPELPPRCVTGGLSYTRDTAETLFRGRPAGRDHLSILGTPPTIERGTLDLYLFTDGVARLELRAPGLPGRRSYDARGRVDGRAGLLPTSCPTVGCDARGYAGGRYVFGGATRDVGGLGYTESLAYSVDRTSYPVASVPVPVIQPHPVHACVYPAGGTDGTPATSAHPLGCDPPSRRDTLVYDTDGAVNEVTWGAAGQSGLMMSIWNPAVRGDGYAGYRAGFVTDAPTGTVTAGYGIWFAYGIR